MAEIGSEQRLRTKYIHVKQQLAKSRLQLARLELILPTKENEKWLRDAVKYFTQKVVTKQDFLGKLEQYIKIRQKKDRRG